MSSTENEIALRLRVAELEQKVDQLYRHLGLTYVAPTPQVPPDVMAAVRAGNLIEAIRLYRLAYKVDLATAKKAVEALSRG